MFEDWDSTRGTYHTLYRVYDSRVGRWYQVEPKWESYAWVSGYVVNGGNPVMYVDPLGDYPRGRKWRRFWWNAKMSIKATFRRIFSKKWVKVKGRKQDVVWFRVRKSTSGRYSVSMVRQSYLEGLKKRVMSSDTVISNQASRLYKKIMKEMEISVLPPLPIELIYDKRTGIIRDVWLYSEVLKLRFWVARGYNKVRKRVRLLYEHIQSPPSFVRKFFVLNDKIVMKRPYENLILKRRDILDLRMWYSSGYLSKERESWRRFYVGRSIYNTLPPIFFMSEYKFKMGYVERYR